MGILFRISSSGEYEECKGLLSALLQHLLYDNPKIHIMYLFTQPSNHQCSNCSSQYNPLEESEYMDQYTHKF